MNLADHLATDQFLSLVEFRPPKGVDVAPFLEIADRVKGRIQAFVVPENPGGIMTMIPAVLARKLVEAGHESIVVLASRDHNRLALQSLMLGLSADGVQNIVMTRGVDPAYGDHPRATAVHDLLPHEALAALRALAGGRDMTGSPVEPAPSLLGGAEIDPFVAEEDLKSEIGEAEKRVGVGARFLLTPPVHDAERFASAIQPFAGLGVPVIARVMLLKSVGMARYLNRNVTGDKVPAQTIKRLRKAPDKAESSIQIAAEMVKQLESQCHGVCFQPLGWEEQLPALMELL